MRSYLARRPAPADAAELARHRLVGYVEDLIYAPDLGCAGEFLPGWRSQLEISSAMGQLAAVGAGAGIGVLHDYLARRDPALTPVLPELRVLRSYWVAVHEDLRDAARVRVVGELLSEIVRKDPTGFALR